MNFKKAKPIITVLAAVTLVAVFEIVHQTEPVKGAPMPVPTPTPLEYPLTVHPSFTDGPLNDGSDPCGGPTAPGIGCFDQWGDKGTDKDHYLLLPPTITNEGKLLVFLCGGDGHAEPCQNVFPVAAELGYHVIGLTYPNDLDSCKGLSANDSLDCFGEVMNETVTGVNHSSYTNFSDHGQDSIVNRLVNVLKWVRNKQNPGDGWERYLTNDGEPDWTKIHLAGFSNGSSHASFMGTQFQEIGRVALFSGPNDGEGNSEHWRPSHYIQEIDGITNTRYYGLVHYLNNAKSYLPSDNVLFKVTENWAEFGMEGLFLFDPSPGEVQDFGNAHVLISLDAPPPGPEPTPVPSQGTSFVEAHPSTIKDKYCSEFELDTDSENDLTDYKCAGNDGPTIGYKPAWRCVLGSGDRYASERPVSNAGANQTVECQGGGGTTVELDGSGSTDADCDILKYAWAGPFGLETGRNPSVFCPVGFNFIALVASDDWWESLVPSTTLVNVVDTTPPSLNVVLLRTVLWPADHRLVRIDATVTSSDSCGAAPVQVELTSITNSQADNGLGDGDTDRDIQEASYGTFDTSFFLRAERAGNITAGRTYTVTYTATDASGNQTVKTATVYVPHAQ